MISELASLAVPSSVSMDTIRAQGTRFGSRGRFGAASWSLDVQANRTRQMRRWPQGELAWRSRPWPALWSRLSESCLLLHRSTRSQFITHISRERTVVWPRTSWLSRPANELCEVHGGGGGWGVALKSFNESDIDIGSTASVSRWNGDSLRTGNAIYLTIFHTSTNNEP